MRSNFVLLSCFLLVPAVLAELSTCRQSSWAGAVLQNDKGAFNYVNGTFTAPQLAGDPGSAVAQWVAIDQDGCRETYGSLRCGILSTVSPSNETQHQGFISWLPNPLIDLDIAISTGDHIRVTLNIIGTSAGSLIFENVTKGLSVTKTFQSSTTLCASEAGWVVGCINSSPFSPFFLVSITDAAAGIQGDTPHYPSEATTGEVDGNGDSWTRTATYSDGSLTVVYIA